MRNKELFYRIADHIEMHPELYDQVVWREQVPCGTVHCVAGTAVALEWSESAWRHDPDDDPELNPVMDFAVVDPATGHRVPVSRAAQRLLGLSEAEAEVLFFSSWEPSDGLTVPQALRLIGNGSLVDEVTRY